MSKSIWHTAAETPKAERYFIEHYKVVVGDKVYWKYGLFKGISDYDYPFDQDTARWCYLDDLLALETENQRLQEKLNETQSLFDKESKDHWHKHKIALKLQEQLSIAIEGLTYMRNNCLDYAADYMDKADEILEQITALEQKD